MARFEIKSKDGLSVRFSGKPVYNGSYLKPSSLTFSEVNSPTPIAWEVGDYVDYTRTGMRYYLYSIPQPTKRAKMGTRGDAFSYSGVQFFAATKELEIALFKDLVNSDNNIHFSTSPDVATFENVEGVARRIQSCMDYFFPNRWEIRIADFDEVEDAEIIEKINTAKDFALSNGTCLDALSRIYELWQDIGWIHTNENGKEVIIIGYPNKRISENTTDAFVYGKGNGLTAIKKNQTNKDEFATRLYVYGSERNLPARYYNDKDILNAESVDIRNLMLPLDKWGLTDGKPDARKAYLENAEAVAKYGLIPKTHYFDSEEAGADIYPTISGMTIGAIREALTALGQTDSDYFPSAELYPDASQRVDKVRWCDNPDDHGDVGDVLLNGSPSMFDGETKSVDVSSGTRTANIVENKLMASAEFSYSESRTCKVRFSTAVSGYVNDDGFESVVVKMRLSDSNNANSSMSKVVEYPAVLNGGKWEFTLPSVEYDYGQIPKTIFGAYAFLTIAVTLPSGSKDKSISYVLNTGIQHLDLYLIMEKTFLLRLHEIGFDIDKQASLGKGKVISMKTGACAGRSFVIESCRHKGGIYTQGYWDLTLKRQKDNTLGLMFPNVNAQIAEGDEFVLTDIAMPELYVQAAMLRLLSEGQKLLTRASSIQNLYEPSIDAKVMIAQGRTLREGMFMEISDADVVDNTTEYILIDTLSIHEDESAIPTYKVTLKERRKVTYKGTPSATSTDNTESVEDDVQTEVNIDLSEYAKKAEVEEVSELLSSMWQLEGDTIVATKDVRIKANLIVEQDTSSGGEGQDTPSAGLDESEVLDIVKGYTYSKSEINKLIDDVNAGDVDLTNYYTKDEVDAKIPSLDGYATEDYVDDAITALNVGQYAKASDLATLQGEVYNIETVLGLSETAEGYINTWAEVVAFLDGYKNADDLATILAGINGDIDSLETNKADNTTVTALAERVSANEGAIDDNAGNIKKNSDAIDALDKRVTDEEAVTTTYASWWADLKKYIKVEGSNVKIDTNLIVSGDTSSGGSGQDTPASGTVTGIKVSSTQTLTPNNAGIIDMVSVLSSIDVSDQLTAYAKTEDVNAALLTKQDTISDLATIRDGASKGATALQSITKNMVDSVLGSTAAGNANRFLMSTGSTSVWASISDYALPLSGGTMALGSGIYSPLDLEYGAIGFNADHIAFGSPNVPTKIRSSVDPVYLNNSGVYTLIHSGNIGDYKAGDSDKLGGYDASVYPTFENAATCIGFNLRTDYIKLGQGDGHIEFYDGGWYNSMWGKVTAVNGFVGTLYLGTGTIRSSKSGTDRVFIDFGSAGDPYIGYGTASAGIASHLCGNNIYLHYGTSRTNGLILNSSGNVTIGGSDLAGTSAKLYVDNGMVTIVRANSATQYYGDNATFKICTANPSGASVVLGLSAHTSEYCTIQSTKIGTGAMPLSINPSGGNVLIGTTTDCGYKLVTNGTALSTNVRTQELRLGEADAGGNVTQNNWYYAKIGYVYEDTSPQTLKPAITFSSMYSTHEAGSEVELMRITAKGNVGIGTASPQYKLDVNGIINTSEHISVGYSGLRFANNPSYALFMDSNNKVNISGYYGINLNGAVTMSSTLSVGGNTTINGIVTLPVNYQIQWGTTGYMIYGTASRIQVDAPLIVSGNTEINGNLVVSGDTSSGSDIRFKDIIKNKTIKIEHIAKAPLFTFKWNDREDDTIHLGSSAQYWEKVTPWLVKGEDFKTLDYATLGVAMGISLAKKAVNHEERIKALERKVKSLEEENRRLRYGS